MKSYEAAASTSQTLTSSTAYFGQSSKTIHTNVSQTCPVVDNEQEWSKLNFPTAIATYQNDLNSECKLPTNARQQHLLHFADKHDTILLGIGLGINVVAGAMLPVCVLLSGEFLDAARDKDIDTVDFWCGLQALAGVVCFITSWVGTTCLEWAAENQYARAKAYFYQSLLDQDQTFKASFDNGELSDILAQHGSAYRGAIGAKLGQLTILAAQFVAGYIVALATHWRLALILSCMIPVLLAGGGFTMWAMSNSGKKMMKTYSEAASIVEECLINMRTVISYGLEEVFLNKYDGAISRTLKVAKKGALLLGLGMGISMGSLFAFYSLGFWAQGKMIAADFRRGCDPNGEEAGCLTVGMGITVFFCIAFGSFSLGQVATPLTALVQGRTGLKQLLDITYRSSDIPSISEPGKDKIVVTGLIEFIDVGFAYEPTEVDETEQEKTPSEEYRDATPGSVINSVVHYQRSVRLMSVSEAEISVAISTRRLKSIRRSGPEEAISRAHRNQIAMLERCSDDERRKAWVFTGLNLKIRAGESVAFVGPSGCGKSTIAKLVLRYLDVSDGSLKISGRDIRNIDLMGYRASVGFVGQEPQLFNDTVRANILHGNQTATMDEVIYAAKMANAHAFIQTLPQGYETNIGENGSALSGGQRQRLAIARALVRKPKILVLDEATSALDNTSERVVQNNIFKYLKQAHCTLITIAHRLSTIQDCDRIVVFQTFSNIDVHNSRVKSFVAEMGSHDVLLRKNGVYASMVKAQGLSVTAPLETVPETRTHESQPLFQMDTLHRQSPALSLYNIPTLTSIDSPQPSPKVPRHSLKLSPRPSPDGLGPARVGKGYHKVCLTSDSLKRDTEPLRSGHYTREFDGQRTTIYDKQEESDSRQIFKKRDRGSMPFIQASTPSNSPDGLSRKERLLSMQFAKNHFEAFRKDENLSISSVDQLSELASEASSTIDEESALSSELTFEAPASTHDKLGSGITDEGPMASDFCVIRLTSTHSPVRSLPTILTGDILGVGETSAQNRPHI